MLACMSSFIMNPSLLLIKIKDLNSKQNQLAMSQVRLGINGFGRIGRLTFRSAMTTNSNKAQVMAINDPFMDLDYLMYLLKYDSVHGKYSLIYQMSLSFLMMSYLHQDALTAQLRRPMAASKSTATRSMSSRRLTPPRSLGERLAPTTSLSALVSSVTPPLLVSISRVVPRRSSSLPLPRTAPPSS